MRGLERTSNLLRYHHPGQFAWRAAAIARRRWGRRFRGFHPDAFAASTFRQGAEAMLVALAQRRQRLFAPRVSRGAIDALAAGQFTFLNETLCLAKGDLAQLNWQPESSRLWRFHLQSQEYLLPLAMRGRADVAWQIVGSWLTAAQHASPYEDEDAWHPFCISRRMPPWLMLAAVAPPPDTIAEPFWCCVTAQAAWLRSHLERDLGGNHLLENLRAIVMFDSLLQVAGNHAAERLDTGLLLRQIQLQILPSGEHVERTPTYHALMQLALLETADALRFTQHPDADRVHQSVFQMGAFLRSILHPDGDIPLLGDSVFEETPEPLGLIEESSPDPPSPQFAARPGQELAGPSPYPSSPQFAARQGRGDIKESSSDYWIWRDREDFLLMDCGPMGCDWLPAHAHADLFHLEASVGGQRLWVDSGTYDYEDSPMRATCRSTAAHNTLQIEGIDHADMWSRFRVGRRGHPVWKCSGGHDELKWCAAAHDAYRHLGVTRLVRIVAALPGPAWLIVDWVSGEKACDLHSRLHFHPAVTVQRVADEDRLQIQCGDRSLSLHAGKASELRLGSSEYCPNFGVRETRAVAEQRLRASAEHRWLAWVLRAENGEQEAESVNVDFAANRLRVDWGKYVIEIERPLAKNSVVKVAPVSDW